MESETHPNPGRPGKGPTGPLRFVPADTLEAVDHLQLASDMLQLAVGEENKGQEEYFFRKAEIAALIAIAKASRGTPFQAMMRRALDEAERLVAAWEQTAAEHARNETFYRDLVVKIGKMFGQEAYISDDGSVQEDVLCLKVPELVRELFKDLKVAMEIVRVASPHMHFCEHPECKVCQERREEVKRLTRKYPT